jgi:hypothetical protein
VKYCYRSFKPNFTNFKITNGGFSLTLSLTPSHLNSSFDEALLKSTAVSPPKEEEKEDQQPRLKYSKSDPEDGRARVFDHRLTYLKYYREGQLRILEELCQELTEIIQQCGDEEDEGPH